MSEIVEIKIMRRKIVNNILSKKINSFSIDKLKLVDTNTHNLKKYLIASTVKDIYVLGRSLVFKLSSGYYLLVNMQSSGFFIYQKKIKDQKYIKAKIVFSDMSRLLFVDPRGYSYLKLLNQKQFNKHQLSLGIDVLSKKFNYSVFLSKLSRRTTSIKNVLSDQNVFQGLGNVYGDEICFEARLNPGRSISTIKTSELKRLYKSILKILRKSLEYDGVIEYLPVSSKTLRFDNFLQVYSRQGKECYRCSGKIVKQKTGRTSSYFCPLCQN